MANGAARLDRTYIDVMPSGERGSFLAIHLIDLRVEYEAELRVLTYAQRLVEEIRVARSEAHRNRAFDKLLTAFTELRRFNAQVEKKLAEIVEETQALRDRATNLPA